MSGISDWHYTEVGLWWHRQMARVNDVIDSTGKTAADVRVAQKQKVALLQRLHEVEAQYKRGEKVQTTWDVYSPDSEGL